ncbi:ABC transporter ATP-binding protein [Thermicanus aegyptius]|uniref:ABC transporter ATP-binding protein n=1 Tax=Thermicanus aegyptius TaxID=94009 RepID=UPI0004049EDE|nr:ABC transporter ATP-binding protein [Thermicanus aegyptius]
MSRDSFHEEEKLGKVYDSALMRRLLRYAIPYRIGIFLSILLLFFITITDLAGPYLIKIAIDDHLNALGKPMAVFESGTEPRPGISFQGKVYVREKDPGEWGKNKEMAEIISTKEGTYLLYGLLPDQNMPYTIEKGEDGNLHAKLSDGRLIPAKPLTPEELSLFRKGDLIAVYGIALLFLGILLLGILLNYMQTRLLLSTGQKIIYDIRQELFAHVERLSLSFFDKNPVGRLVTRVTNDVEALNDMFTSVLVNLFKDLFILLGIMGIMLNLNWKLALISFLTLPLIIAVSYLYKKLAREVFRQVRVKIARINATLAENLSGMLIVHLFKREKEQYRQFHEISTDHFRSSWRELQTNALFRPMMDLIYSVGLALLIWFGGQDALKGVVQVGVLYAFVDYLGRFFQPINDLTEKYTIMQSAMASSERIFQLMDQKPEIESPSAPVPVGRFKGEVRFDHVWFRYRPEEWILKDITFHVNPGEVVAIVGATGAGKSSIIQLLSRFYDIQKGSITIDGIDIRSMKVEDLRRNIGVVLQDVFLFAGDIRFNIRLNNEKITDSDIVTAAKMVNAHSFIEKLPNRYDEEVQERGVTLSSGERQLLSFARTLAFQPSILVLDEATSHIDTETELLIQDALQKLTKGRTTILIAHRLSTIQHADRIIVLHKGEIKEMGTHQELLLKKGLYYTLYQLQYKEELLPKKRPAAGT